VDLLDELARLHAAHGDICMVAGAGQRLVVLWEPRDVEQVFIRDSQLVRKGFAYRRARRLLGNGLITSDGAFHLRQRRMLQPCLQPRRLTPYGEVMIEETDRTLASWPTAGEIDIERDLGRLGLAVIGRTLFDRDLSADATGVYDAVEVARRQFVGSLAPLAPLAQRLPLPSTLAFRRARHTLRGVVEAAIDARDGRDEKALREAPDLLSLLLTARDEDDAPMPRRQLVDEALTNLLAGHDTIANTLTWTSWLLANHPEIADRLAAEADAVLGGPAGRTPTVEDVASLPYARAVFLETLRLYPQCYSMTRTTLEPIDLPSGTRLERGWEVLIPQWSIHRDARWWPDPERFDPARFLDAPGCPRSAPADSDELPRLAFFAFGAGRRVCIGQAYSMMEGVLVLARLAQRVRLTPAADGTGAHPHAMFTLWPGPVRLHVETRA